MDSKAYFLDLLQKLVAIPSVSQEEEPCAEFLADVLREDLGMEVTCERVEGKSVNVYGSWQEPAGRTGKKLLLGGHIDVVPPGEGWETDPFRLTVRGDRAYGRGSFDMKGGLAAQVAVLKMLREEGFQPAGEIELVGLCDEERLSIGANAYAARRQGQARAGAFGIFGEPHFGNVVVGATGKVLLGLHVSGTTGHAAEPETGVNAIGCLAKLIALIDEEYTPRYEAGICASHAVLKIASRWEGYSLNIPDEAEALLNKQLLADEDAEVFRRGLQELYARGVGRGKLAVTCEVPYYPAYRLPDGAPGLALLRQVLAERHGHVPELRINQSVSDANIIYPLTGIPTVLFGPDGGDLHKPNEYVLLPAAYRYMDMLKDFIPAYFHA